MNKNRKMLTMESKPRSFSIKVYDEQLPLGWEKTCEAIRNVDKGVLQVLAICHDADLLGDDIWLPSIEKKHYHIIGRGVNGYSIRIKQLLELLHVEFRQGLDDELWKNHGVETVGKFPNMAMYLQHLTDEAILDGKTEYPIEKIVSNLTIDEIKEVQNGYIRVGQNGGYKKTFTEMAELDAVARKLGYDLGNFNNWYYDLDFGTRCSAKLKVIERSYYDGVERRVREDGTLIRLCIYIKGDKNTGKTYTSKQVLKGKEILEIGGGGTGKFDKLLPSTDAIILSDDRCPNLLNMTDNYMCQAYRRQSNNPYWCGDVFVVTSNLSFDDWLTDCGIKITDDSGHYSEHYRAMKSRFYVCHIEEICGNNRLICDSPSTRGSANEQIARKEKFKIFRDRFNTIIADYHPDNRGVDYEDIMDWIPISDITPFDILDKSAPTTPIPPTGTFHGVKTEDAITKYRDTQPKIYQKAYKNIIKKMAKMGLLDADTQYKDAFEEALIHECATLDIGLQLKDGKKKTQKK